MAFCTQCGSQIGDRDQFCAICGSRQTATSNAGASAGPAAGAGPGNVPPPPRPSPGAGTDFLSNLSPQTAALLCYIPVVGWLPALFVLASNQFRHDRGLRFHAFQGLYLAVAWLLAEVVLGPFVRFSGMFYAGYTLVRVAKMIIFAAWIWMLIKVAQNETFKLPVIGELAEKSVAEQRF